MTLDGETELLPGTIYVVPANRNVEILDRHARLSVGENGPRPSVDLLFRSAADAYGENLIAVVLSGTGSDGALGARFVKTAGGTVIVQNPDTAAYPGMPLSLAPTDVDVTVGLERIAGLITDFVNGTFDVPSSSEHSMLRSFLEELRQESGVDFTTYRQATIQRRVQQRMAATGITSFVDYARIVRRDPDERQRLLKSFLIHVTRFFRDRELFDYLREHVLPELIRDAARRKEELRIWSAGCSTGEEAYSLAIVVYELLEEAGVEMHGRIFATDLDEEAVRFARQGIYPARALDELPIDVVEKYFQQIGDEFQIRKHIRSMLVFGEHDLARRAPFPRIDLILCRNVLIYFTVPLQRRALELFAFSLRNGGYLVLGKSETVSPLGEHFAPDNNPLKVFRRIGSRSQLLRSQMPGSVPASPPKVPALRNSRPASRNAGIREPHTSGRVDIPRDGGGILYGLPWGVVVANRTYDVQYINAEARRLFGIHSTAIDQDLIHLVQRFDPIQLRRLIDQAMHGNGASGGVLTANAENGESVQDIEVNCRVLKGEGTTDIVVTLLDVTEREQVRRRVVTSEEETSRLLKANEEVLAANYRLTRTIQDLRDENEQMQVASAEVQAATEEVETLNEELQASNEELETLNEELQATIEELNTTNDDLESRSLEVQSMAIAAENARFRLRDILDAVDDGVIVVDEHRRVVMQSQSMIDLVGEEGRSPQFLDASGNALDDEHSPLTRVAQGETFATRLQIRSSAGDTLMYEVIGRPASVLNGQRLGVLTVHLGEADAQGS